VSIAKTGLSALGKLLAVALLAGAFLFGMAGVVYMALQGTEIQVPDITGKDFQESEKELASLGLKIKKRADRPSAEKPNTVIEQLPKSGDTVKTGQMILVVTSKPAEGEELPSSLKKGLDEDDTDKIEEMITDKPKKAKNTNNNRKKADTSRDVSPGGNSAGDTNSNSTGSNSNKKDPGAGNSNDKGNTKGVTPPANKPPTAKPAERPRTAKP
jgi:beta-lactam-binding protein with PASTA domain